VPSRWWIAAIVLLISAAVALGLGLRGQQRSLAGPVYTGKNAAALPKVTPAARSLPVTLSIPAIGLNVPLSQLGLNPNGTVEVPTDFQEPGWYRFGPSPGQLGSAVILGHVDSYLGPAVFFKLRTMRPGDQVEVALADGVTTHFVVRQVAIYPKTQFPTVLVYGSHGYSGLQLVTCGGVFDTQTRSYLSNVVVYTSLVAAN
jgi:sortase (surface protein transpeptidase)